MFVVQQAAIGYNRTDVLIYINSFLLFLSKRDDRKKRLAKSPPLVAFCYRCIYHHAKSSSIKKGAACGHPFRYPCPRKNTNAITGKLNIRPDFAYTRIVRALLSGGHCLQNSITGKNKKLKLRRPWGIDRLYLTEPLHASSQRTTEGTFNYKLP